MLLSIERIESKTNATVFSEEVQKKLLDLLYIIPCGPLSIHPKIRAFAFRVIALAAFPPLIELI